MIWRNIAQNKDDFLEAVKRNPDVIVFDTETTGLAKTAKIIQFSAVRYHIDADYRFTETGKMDIYINPEEKLAPKIVDITGITDEMLESAFPERKAAPQIFAFLNSAGLWAAYNKNFDLQKLESLAARNQLLFYPQKCLDILTMARDMMFETEDHKLTTVTGALFPDDHFEFHSAIDDVRASAQCMARFLKMYAAFTRSDDGKQQAHLEWASFFINPRQKSMQRIKLKLNVGEYGDVFWDAIKKHWTCKSGAKPKKLFASLDMANVERQLLNRYGWKYEARDMDTLSTNWGKEKRQKEAEGKAS